ncbi:MAG: DUF3168 domain-containing protein [Cytophagaceae bacterium]|jgi:hypothetical protein
MNIGAAIYSILKNDAAVSAIVGTGDNCKIYPVVIPQGVVSPSVKFHVVHVQPTDTKQGVSPLDVYTIQIDSFAKDTDTSSGDAIAADLDSKIRTALDRYHGTVSGIVIDKIWYQGTQDMYDYDSNEFQKSSDYKIRVKL